MYKYASTFHLPKQNESITPKQTLITEWGNFLETYHWQYYNTFTTKSPMSAEYARNSMTQLFKKLQKEFNPVVMFWVAEPFDTEYGYHTHALLNLNTVATKKTETVIKRSWESVIGCKPNKFYTRTLITPYIRNLGANFYLGKYLHKHSCDHDFFY
jgi:hypothetical protein